MADWSSNNITLTTKGASVLSKVQAGSGSLTITRVVASEQYVAESVLREVTSLSVENLPLTIIDRHEVQDGGSVIQVQLSNLYLSKAFTFNEIGVFATYSDNPSEEFLYIIAQVDADTGDKIPVYATTPVTATYDIYLYNIGADNIEITISSAGLVTYETLSKIYGLIQRNTAYEVGDILHSRSLKKGLAIKCTVAGITKSTDTDLSHKEVGDKVEDGTSQWVVISPSTTADLDAHNHSLDSHPELAKLIIDNSGINVIKRSHAYAKGDIVYSNKIPSWAFLECIVAGTTSDGWYFPKPSEIKVGDTIVDYTVTWKVHKIADTTEATEAASGLMSAADKKAIDGVPSTYIKELSISGTKLTVKKGDNTTATLNMQDNDTTYSVVTQSANGLMLAADKKKLDGIAAGANAYSHPTSSGNKHIPSGGSSGQILRWSANGTATWGADTASKLATARTISLTGNASGSANFDGSGNISISTTVSESKHAATATNANHANTADTASKLATARTISLTGNASGSANFDGSGNVSISTTVNESKHAAAANALNSMSYKTAIKDGTKEPAGLNLYKVYSNGYPVPYGNLLSIGGVGGGELLAEWSGGDKGIGHLYYRNRRDTGYLWSDWRTVAFTSDINSFAPTKTGGGASGTWGINISGNAASATNADKVDGYHASDLLSKIYPVGSIYMSMSATNPATLFGIGTWTRISQGRMLLGANDSTYKARATGGEATHTLTAAEMPAHSHGISTSGDHSHYFYGSDDNNGPLTEGDGLDTDGNGHFTRNVRFTTSSAGAHTHTISNSGGGAAHNNMPPYLVCYIWQRTA